MADEQVLKSFLVSLGFKTDQQSQKSMLSTVAEVTASLRNLAAVAVAATAAAGAAIAKMATDLDELYYSSKRIGSSANEIKAFGHAVGQLGGSAEQEMSGDRFLLRLRFKVEKVTKRADPGGPPRVVLTSAARPGSQH